MYTKRNYLYATSLLQVRYFERGTNSSNQVVTKKTLTEIKGLKEATEYAFQVRAQTANGWGDFSRAVFKKTGLVTDPVFVGEDEGSQVSVASRIVCLFSGSVEE